MTAPQDFVWLDDIYAKHRLEMAIAASKSATIRVQAMKVSAILEPPTAAKGRFPWPHRTCAEWM